MGRGKGGRVGSEMFGIENAWRVGAAGRIVVGAATAGPGAGAPILKGESAGSEGSDGNGAITGAAALVGSPGIR